MEIRIPDRQANDWSNLAGGVSVDTSSHNPFTTETKPLEERFPLAKHPVTLTQSQREEILRHVPLPHLGKAEIDFALLRTEKRTANIAGKNTAIVTAHREQFYAVVKASPLGGTTKPEGEWKRIYAESEAAAKRSLMADSSELGKLDELQLAAKKAAEAVAAAERELDLAFKEFQSLPAKAESIQGRLNAIAAELTQNETAALIASYRQAYSHWYLTGQVASVDHNKVAADLVLAEHRLAVLSEVEPVLVAQLDAIKKRNKELSKRLSVKSHTI